MRTRVRHTGTRTRAKVALAIGLAIALVPAIATPADAHRKTEPYEVEQARRVGRAAETNSINGIYVSPHDGNVYAASVGGDEITVHDPNSGKLLDRLGPERGVGGPDDLFITEDGTIYWTEILSGYVGKYTPGSDPVRQFVGAGVNPITMSDDGRLFTSRIFLGNGFYELDPDLQDPPILRSENLVGLNGFDFGPDGYLYAPSQFTGEVVKIDVDAAVPVGEVVASGLRAPTAVKFNSVGEAHAVDLAEGQVVKLDLVGGQHEVLIDIEGTIDNMAFGTDDRLYAAAGSDNQILRRSCRTTKSHHHGDGDQGDGDHDGHGQEKCRVKALQRPGLGNPGGVAVSPDGTVWVGEFFALRGYETRSRRWTTSFYDRFDPPGVGFASAATVSADGDNLITSSGFSNAVQVLDPATGAIVQDIRTVNIPTNAIRHGDMLVAAQLGAGNVVNADDPSEVLLDGLFVPLGLASDGATLYVGDWATGIVWAVNDAGPSILASGLSSPEGLAVDGDRLLVVEVGLKRVTAIDLATGETSPVIVGLDYSDRVPVGFFPHGQLAGVAVGADRSIYVSDDGVNQVFKFRRRH